MIKYSQLLKSKSKARKNLWYICGDDSALVYDAYAIAKDHAVADTTTTCLGIFNGDVDNSSGLEEFITRPYFEERKLIIVHSPSKIDRIETIISLNDPSTFYILIDYSNQPDSSLVELTNNNQKARAVTCLRSKKNDLELLVSSRLNIESSAASKLVNLSNLDSEWLLNKVSILEFFDVDEITLKMVDLVCNDQGVPDFESSLLEFDKNGCFRYIKDMGVSNISVRSISNSLHKLSILNSAASEFGKQLRPITDKTGLTRKEIDKYTHLMSYYDSPTSKRCFNMLMKLNDDLVNKNSLAYVALVCGW